MIGVILLKNNVRETIYYLISLILFFSFFGIIIFFATTRQNEYVIIAFFSAVPLITILNAFKNHDFSFLMFGNFFAYFLIYAILKSLIVHRNTVFYNLLVRMETNFFAVAQKLLLYGIIIMLFGINSLLLYFIRYKWGYKKNKYFLYFGVFSLVLSLVLLLMIRFV